MSQLIIHYLISLHMISTLHLNRSRQVLLLLFLSFTPSILLAGGPDPQVTITLRPVDSAAAATTFMTMPTLVDEHPISYPQGAIDDRMEGYVVAKLTIDSDGMVVGTELVGGATDLRFRNQVIEGFRSAHFKPALEDQKKVACVVFARVSFTLTGQGEYPEFIPNGTVASYSPSDLQQNVIYPAEALENGLEGNVYLQVYLDMNGNIVAIRTLKSDNPMFEDAARKAVLKTEFSPAIQNEKEVNSAFTVRVMFKIAP